MENQKVLVIGGSSGIGREIARRAHERGAAVTITGRDPQRLAAAAREIGAVQTVVVNAHDEAALELLFAETDSFDHIVSMVGDSMAGGFLTTAPQTMRHVLHSKFFTNWLIGRHAAKKLNPGGSLTFTSGTGGRAHDISASYVANLGVTALVAGLAFEMAPHHRVNAVAPTFMGTQTSFWRQTAPGELQRQQDGFSKMVPLERVGTVAEVAEAYLHLITNTFITGQTLAVDGGVMLAK